jgi:hypothetical protein
MSLVSPEFIAGLRDASVFAPELPQSEAKEVFEIISDYERRLVLPVRAPGRELKTADYGNGTAIHQNQVRILNPETGGFLVSADHATDPMRKGKRIGADHGTAGLAAYLAYEHAGTGIIPIGGQTGNAAVTPNHPVKQAMDRFLPGSPGFVSLHGMRSGKLLELDDRTEIHGLIGLGKNPNQRSRQVAEELSERAKQIGLRVLIGNETRHIEYLPETDELLTDKDTGEPRYGQLAALGDGTTTNHAQEIMRQSGGESPAFQIELTRLLRLVPADFEQGWHTDARARVMGVYLGYLLSAEAVSLITADAEQ